MKTFALFGCVLSALCAAEKVVQTKPGGTVIFECGIKQIPTTLKWLQGDQQLFSINPKTGMALNGKGDIVKRSKLKDEKNLEISNIKNEDAGRFKCETSKEQEEHRLVVVSVSVFPSNNLRAGGSARLQCEVAGLTSGSTVEWIRPDGQRVPSHTVDLPSVDLSDAGTWMCAFNADGKEALIIEVTEWHPKTTSAPSTTRMTGDNTLTCLDCDNNTTDAAPTLGGLSWWIWAAVGGGCLLVLLVLLLCVFVLVMYKRMTRRQKRRFEKMRKPKEYCQCPTAAAQPNQGRPLPPRPVQRR